MHSSRNLSLQSTIWISIICLLLLPLSRIRSQDLPLGYLKYYSQNAADASFHTSLVKNSADSWKVSKYKCTLIKPVEKDSAQISLFPESQGIIPNLVLGEYIMEFEFKLMDSCTTDSSGFYLMSPVKECGNFYAFGFTKDSLVFYYPKDQVPVRLSAKAHGLDLQEWTKVKLIRNMLKRTFRFELEGTEKAELFFRDKRLIMGYVGFGTQDVNTALRNIRIWAPTAFQDGYYHCE